MNRRLLAALGLAVCVAPCAAADFAPPVRLKSGDAAVRVESPGYACGTVPGRRPGDGSRSSVSS